MDLLAPQRRKKPPHDSGGSKRDQGISKAGNARVRTMMVEIAWLWLRHQPNSKLSRWFILYLLKAGRPAHLVP
jgi:transposase